jgi:hypothetical protein
MRLLWRADVLQEDSAGDVQILLAGNGFLYRWGALCRAGVCLGCVAAGIPLLQVCWARECALR